MTKEEYTEWKSERYSFYKDRIADLRERAASSSDFIDNHLISVSSGVVGLSFALLNFVETIAGCRSMLYLSWVCFLSVIILVFASHELLRHHWDLSANKWEEWFQRDQSGEPNMASTFEYLNIRVMWTAKLLFIAAFALLVTFIGYNLPA